MNSPFTTFKVLPAYGLARTVVQWELAERLEGSVYFYRSESGAPGSWTILNPDDPSIGTSGEFMDCTPATDIHRLLYYRGLLDTGGTPDTWLKGPGVMALDNLTRREYFLAREILRREYHGMSGPQGNGLRAFHFVLKHDGLGATTADTETNQLLGPPCEGDPANGRGTLWSGGFYAPLQTWVRIMKMDPEEHKPRADGTGDDQNSPIKLRMLSFPRPDPGHVVVLAESDRRYVVASPIEPFYLRGAVPVAWQVTAEPLDRDDTRYRMPLPALLADSM